MVVVPEQFNGLKKLIALLVLVISLVLLLMALPRFRSALNYLSVDVALEKISNQQELDLNKVEQLISTTRSSIELHDSPRFWEGMSELLLYQAQKADVDAESKESLIKQAKSSVERSLLQSPANAYLWYRLAVINVLLRQPDENIVPLLIMSMITGPKESGIVNQRLSLSLDYLAAFEAEDLDLIEDQVITAWTLSPTDFIHSIAEDQRYMDIIRQILSENDAELLNDMEQAREKTH